MLDIDVPSSHKVSRSGHSFFFFFLFFFGRHSFTPTTLVSAIPKLYWGTSLASLREQKQGGNAEDAFSQMGLMRMKN